MRKVIALSWCKSSSPDGTCDRGRASNQHDTDTTTTTTTGHHLGLSGGSAPWGSAFLRRAIQPHGFLPKRDMFQLLLLMRAFPRPPECCRPRLAHDFDWKGPPVANSLHFDQIIQVVDWLTDGYFRGGRRRRGHNTWPKFDQMLSIATNCWSKVQVKAQLWQLSAADMRQLLDKCSKVIFPNECGVCCSARPSRERRGRSICLGICWVLCRRPRRPPRKLFSTELQKI